MRRVSGGTESFYSTSENNLSNCNLLFCFGPGFLKYSTPYKQHRKWQARLRKKSSIKTRMNIVTHTYTVSNTMIWHAVCCITEQERGELTFYRKNTEKKESKKKEACLQSYIRANRKLEVTAK